MNASPHAALRTPTSPPSGRCRSCTGDLGAWYSPGTDFVVDLYEGGKDLLFEVGDTLQDWTGLPVGDIVRDLVDIAEDLGKIAFEETRAYLVERLSDPAVWVNIGTTLAACIPSGGAACIAAAGVISADIAARIVTRGIAYAAARAAEKAKPGMGAKQRARIDAMSDDEIGAMARDLMNGSAWASRARDEAMTALQNHPEFKRIMDRLDQLREARAARIAHQQRIRDVLAEGERKLAAQGYTYWGERDELYPLQDYMVRRLAGETEVRAWQNSVPKAVRSVSYTAVRAAFPSLRRLRESTQRMARVFVDHNGMREPAAGLEAVRVALAAAQQNIAQQRVSARAVEGGREVWEQGPRVEAPGGAVQVPAKKGVQVDVRTGAATVDSTSRRVATPAASVPSPKDSPPAPPAPEPPPVPVSAHGAGGVLIPLVLVTGLVLATRRAA